MHFGYFSARRAAAGCVAIGIAVLATVPPHTTLEAQTSGLVAAYAFNEGAGATVADLSGANNTGTIGGTGTWTATGKYGGALRFNGTNTRVTVPDSASLDLTTGMTVLSRGMSVGG